ncbi:ABC transporter permease [Eubacterium xylanophilum]|uniref:ABC transporter permease n=1 Tax=Eubacterium xylanophilum TaxID=39497 RepID=UPI00047CAA08|nr:ABC transporter permease [Eubacterium xylanophilum]
MLILENIKLALASLAAGKMRALLTMLGIIIGIGSVIAIMTVSESLTNSISDSFQEMGASNVTVGVKQSESESETRSNGLKFGAMSRRNSIEEEDRISDEMIREFKEKYKDEIEAISINESLGSGTVSKEDASANITLTGINAEYFTSEDITLLAGRKLSSSDISGNKSVIMVSDKLVETLFGGNNEAALSQKIGVNINNVYYYYYIVGVYEYDDSGTVESTSDSEVTTSAYVPLTTGKEQMHSDDGYTQLTVVTSSKVTEVSSFADEIEDFFNQYYVDNDDYEISTSTMESLMESMNETIGNVSIAISFIAAISLLVGGIGVMNIMLVSITERTREIGTRKALGAGNGSIRLQFITESIILCLMGGILGIILGFILGAVAASILGYSASAPISAIMLSVGFSMVIGVFFGYYPANKAAKMDPIEALRYE